MKLLCVRIIQILRRVPQIYYTWEEKGVTAGRQLVALMAVCTSRAGLNKINIYKHAIELVLWFTHFIQQSSFGSLID
jgi:hypothetical protein